MFHVWVRRYGAWVGALSALLALGVVVLVGGLGARGGESHVRPLQEIPAAAPGLPQGAVLPAVALATTPASAYAQAVLDALNCVRARAQLPPLTLDPALSHTAIQLWHAQVQHQRDLAAVPDDAAGGATLRVLLPLVADPTAPAPGPCGVGGLDLSPLQLTGVQVVGIAVFADPAPALARDFTTAVILAR